MTLMEEARIALDAKGVAERQLAAAAYCPPWRHAVFGLVMAALVATPVLPLPLRLGASALILASIALIVHADRRRTGMFVNGYRRGKTMFVSLTMIAIILPIYFLSIRAADGGSVLTPLALAGLAFVVSVVGSVIWQRVFVFELGA